MLHAALLGHGVNLCPPREHAAVRKRIQFTLFIDVNSTTTKKNDPQRDRALHAATLLCVRVLLCFPAPASCRAPERAFPL